MTREEAWFVLAAAMLDCPECGGFETVTRTKYRKRPGSAQRRRNPSTRTHACPTCRDAARICEALRPGVRRPGMILRERMELS